MINFLKFKFIYLLISATFIGFGIFSIFSWGFIYSVDFAGGTNTEYQVNKTVSKQKIKSLLEKEKIEVINISESQNVLTLRTNMLDDTKQEKVRNLLSKELGSDIAVLKSETVGPSLGKEMIRKTVIASALAIVGILLYMSYAFKGLNFAFAAIVALVHDFFIVVGGYSLLSHFFGAQVDTLFVTAVLTSMSFSVHDTIVIFDKIREYIKTEGRGDIERYANKALTETLVRSFNNSMTIIFMLLALTLLGGSTIKFFVIALLIGTVTGTYSSPFVATPIVVFLEKQKVKKDNARHASK